MAMAESMPTFYGLPVGSCRHRSVSVIEQSKTDLEAFLEVAWMALEHELKECNGDVLGLTQDLDGSAGGCVRERERAT